MGGFVRALFRFFFGRRARWFYLALLFLLLACSSGVRLRTYLLTRKIQAVLSGLKSVRVDGTTEEQLLKSVPYLVLSPDRRAPSNERHYFVNISNKYEDMQWLRWVPNWLYSICPPRAADNAEHAWDIMPLPFKAAYVFGWRHLFFVASVEVLDGTVSRIYYEIEPDVFLGWPRSNFVVARSAHAFWRERGPAVPVSSTDEERPEFRFGPISGQYSRLAGDDNVIGVVYTPDAPPELISHVFTVNLTCFWGIRGCASVRDVAQLLREDRRAIREATESRLRSRDPCPDRILAERVRYFLDLNVALLELIDSKQEPINAEGDRSTELVIDYRLKELIRGRDDGPFTGIRPRRGPLVPFIGPGNRMLYFSGAKFDSCRIVPATPSAEAAVRSAVPNPKRREDDVSLFMYGRL